MKKTILLSVLAALCLFLKVSAQQRPTHKPLKIGDHIPEFTLRRLFNNSSTTQTLADPSSKLVLIDFWATWCAGCLEGLPKYVQLQEKYGKGLRIIAVSNETESKIRSAAVRHPILKSASLTVLYSDTMLNQLFPHRYLPHIVWIKDGVYIGATESDYVTAENIDKALNSKYAFKQKVDNLTFDKRQPLFPVDNSTTVRSPILNTSILTGYLYGMPLKSGIYTDTAAGTQRLYLINHPIAFLYANALDSDLPLTPNRRIVELPIDAFEYPTTHPYYQEWAQNNTYSWEGTTKVGTPLSTFKRQLRQSLDAHLGYMSRIEKRETECIIIKQVPTNLTTRFKKKDFKPEGSEQGVYFHYAKIGDLVYYLNKVPAMPYVINESNMDSRIDVNLGANPINADEWIQRMQKAGIELQKEKRLLDVFVLTSLANPSKPSP